MTPKQSARSIDREATAMTDPDAASVLPATAPLIAHARGLSTGTSPLFDAPNIGSLVARHAAATPDKTFLTFYEADGRAARYSYREFYNAVVRLSAMLCGELGLQPGDRIATLRGNDPYTVALYFAAWTAGLAVAPINCGEDDERVAFILENSEARVLFAAEAQEERLPRVAKPELETRVTHATGEAPEYALDTRPPPGSDAPGPAVSADAEALLVYTSGTTGPPKGVVLDQSNMLTDAHSIADWHRFGPDDRAMCVLPIHHVNGTVVTLVTPLYTGGSVVLHRRFHAGSFWTALAAERCTWVSVVPTLLAFLCERGGDLSSLDLSRFRHIICGAGPLTTELAHRFDAAFGKRVVHGYGLSETTCYSSFLPIDLDSAAYARWMFEQGFPSIGCAISANEMAIHDPDGSPLTEGVRGEIVARGPNVMKYYFKRPDANRDTFAHGWFRSGDEGFFKLGADGAAYYFITGRLKELIIRGGVNYSPFDIDEVLNSIAGVRAAMAVGFDNTIYGEEIGAYVQREPESQVSEADILAACRAALPFAKCPKVVVFGDTFPVTSTGKYQRNRLKPLFAEWRDTQFREQKGGRAGAS
jgi:long-chain acyl-CoA synthetase